MYVKFDVTTKTFIEGTKRLPRRSPWGAYVWADPGARLKNCPKELRGFGWAPVKHVDPALSPWETPVKADIATGSLVGDVWEVPSTKRRRDKEDVYKEKLGEINSRVTAAFADGFTYNGVVFDIQKDDQRNMTSCYALLEAGVAGAHGGYWRSRDNTNVAMTAAEIKTFFAAAWNYGANIVRNAHKHKDALMALKANGVKTAKQLYEYDTSTGWGA